MSNRTITSSKFSKLLGDHVQKRGALSLLESFLMDHKAEIQEARSLGVGFKKIADLLTEAGIKANAIQVKSFCVRVLNEKPRLRRKRKPLRQKAEHNTSKTSKKLQIDIFQPKSEPKRLSRPGFRSAVDDEDL